MSGLLLEPGEVPKTHQGLKSFREAGAGLQEDSISNLCLQHVRPPDEQQGPQKRPACRREPEMKTSDAH